MLREVTTEQMADAMDEMMQMPDEAEGSSAAAATVLTAGFTVKEDAKQAKQQFKAALHQIFPDGKVISSALRQLREARGAQIKEDCRISMTAFPRDKNTSAGVRCTNKDTGATNSVISPYLSEMLFDPFHGQIPSLSTCGWSDTACRRSQSGLYHPYSAKIGQRKHASGA